MVKLIKAPADISKLLISSAFNANPTCVNNLLSVYKCKFKVLTRAYKKSMIRALKLTPSHDVLSTPGSLIEQGIKCRESADLLRGVIDNLLTNDKNATYFWLSLIKIDDYQLLEDFYLLYSIYINVSTSDKYGMTGLHIAAANGNLQITQMLLNLKINVNVVDVNRKTALHHAITEYHPKIAEILLKSGAGTGTVDMLGRAPIHLVMPGKFGSPQLFELLVQNGADINKKFKDRTMLSYAVYDNRPEAVRFLLNLGASKYLPSVPFGSTAYAIKFEYYYETPLDLARKLKFYKEEDCINNQIIIYMLSQH